ncbi:hypothetical protein [Gryllotalpicola sp.]|uniref:hypothetical protein n=1 Tax=Gryllotalpicola sp. TaxID=1932787 RepID=UPI002632EA98|nr:hypothetical protein [Gryllotalpicola sp.]
MSLQAWVDENPWVSDAPLPSRHEERRGLLAPVEQIVGRRKRPVLFYAAAAVAAILAIVCVQLGFSIAVSNGAYQLASLQQTQDDTSRSLQAATEQVATLSSPQNLARNAAALGMVESANPVYLNLKTGHVLGQPSPGVVSPVARNLVPNSLLTGVPIATYSTAGDTTPGTHVTPDFQNYVPKAGAYATAGKTAAKPATPKANPTPAATGPVAWPGGLLPSPNTH